MRRKAFVLGLVMALFLGETYYFYGQCLAGFVRLLGERAFYRNELGLAWRYSQRALKLGGPRGLLENDLIEVLLFGLDQREVGVRTDLPLEDDPATSQLRSLTGRAIRRVPYLAAHWSVASDIFLRESRLKRRQTPLDLSAVSEEPLENLTAEDWWGIAALERAAALEPSNYLYDDLLAEQFLTFGAVEQAAAATRRAVSRYPVLDGHVYLTRADLPVAILDAAVAGFQEAHRGESLVAKASIEMDAGRLLVFHGDVRGAIPFLERAARDAPDSYDTQMQLGFALFRLERSREAIPHLVKAAERLPEEPSTYYYLGQAQMQAADPAAGIESLRRARILGKGAPKYFHALAEALESEGLLQEAERQFTAAAFQNPGDVSAWGALLAFHLRHGNHAAASRDCEKLLAADSTDARSIEQCTAVERGAP